ncbi:MAG: hypothetical protein PHH58_11280 [Rhodoferax sp.]|nr:hypothetical protein [Rhodoferax sp.]
MLAYQKSSTAKASHRAGGLRINASQIANIGMIPMPSLQLEAGFDSRRIGFKWTVMIATPHELRNLPSTRENKGVIQTR